MNLAQYPKVQAEFEHFYYSVDANIISDDVPLVERFYFFPFDFQQGVYDAYFRSVGIEAESKKHTPFTHKASVKDKECDILFEATFDDPIRAKIAALSEAARIREEQLNK